MALALEAELGILPIDVRLQELNRMECLKLLKSDFYPPKNIFICFNESPLKMMKNACFVLKIIKFLSWLFGHVKKN